MNHVYRIIWSDASATFIAVAETAGSHGKRSLGKRVRTLRALALAASVLAGANVLADPTGGQVSAGSGRIEQSGVLTTITQATPKMAINWQGFNIAAGETVNFVQPNTSAVALNRVLGTNGTQILGQLNANGQVFVLNPNGVLFGKGAQVSVGGIVASTLQMSDSDFMAGKLTFAGAGGTVTNDGRITANGGGYVSLLGGQVSNNGTITAKMGTVALGAGQQVMLDFSGDGLLKMTVDKGLADALSDNRSLIQADGGSVMMAAQTADVLRASVVNNDGVIQARSLENRDGVIRLAGTQIRNAGKLDASGTEGANGGRIEVNAGYAMLNSGSLNASGANGGVISVTTHNLIEAGQYDASGTAQGGSISLAASRHIEQVQASGLKADGGSGTGGTIRIEAGGDAWLSGSATAHGRSGGEIAVTAPDLVLTGARLGATGDTGGGRIRVGGGWQGRDGDLANAARTRLIDTQLDVSATRHGSGGTAVIWSDKETLFGGKISATGGTAGGDGGMVEVSSHGQLGFGGKVDTHAPQGQNGRLLLDPKDIEIVAAPAGILVLPLVDPKPFETKEFGSNPRSIVELMNGSTAMNRIVIAAPNDNEAGILAGAARLYHSQTGALIATLTGNAGDEVGKGGVTALANGNYVVNSYEWNKPAGATTGLGAVTWGDWEAGINGIVGTGNSLVGSKAGDLVGFGGVTALTNGNYVVSSPNWANGTATNAGAASWLSGTSAHSGEIETAISLVGGGAENQVSSGGITQLTNGNYVVSSPKWSDALSANAGAATLRDGKPNTTAGNTAITRFNSLVGNSNDQVSSGGIIALTKGNYVVSSPNWNDGTSNTKAGAATWRSDSDFNLSSSSIAPISSFNSLVGSKLNDQVGSRGITALTNGHYVVSSPHWTNGTAANAGAATWGSGINGVAGIVASTNSLVGFQSSDQVGSGGVTALTHGNYVVSSPEWKNGTASAAGASSWRNGTTGLSAGYQNGAVTTGNSLVGSTLNDRISGGGTIALNNDNYVVISPLWNNGSTADVGAVTMNFGEVNQRVGPVTSLTSIIGTRTSDQVGSGGVAALSNGNFVVSSPLWDSPTIQNAGAVMWVNGGSGVVPTITIDTSLHGSTSGDQVGSGGVTALSNGNFVVSSPLWNGSFTRTGAVTWNNGQAGVSDRLTGPLSSSNSLVGTAMDDQVGFNGVTALTNGYYVVRSQQWGGGMGAVSWGNGATSGTRLAGTISAANSLTGAAGNNLGSGVAIALSDGRAIVGSPLWDAPDATDTGRVDIIGDQIPYTFATSPNGKSIILTGDLDALLSAGTSVTLQANNDITVSSPITAANVSTNPEINGGNGGNLTLQAGRSILVNASISTDNGNLTLTANETAANGVISAQRDNSTGSLANIVMAKDTSIVAGKGYVNITIADGATAPGTTPAYHAPGSIVLGAVTANTIRVVNAGGTANSNLDLNEVLMANAGSGEGIVLATEGFTNFAGSNALITGGSRWLIWNNSANRVENVGGLVNDFKQYGAIYGVTNVAQSTGNGFLYAATPSLTATLTGAVSKVYDANNTAKLAAGNYAVSVTVSGDVATYKTTPQSGTYDNQNVGDAKPVTVSGLDFTVTGSNREPVYGYVKPTTVTSNVGAISQAPLTIAANPLTKVYDGDTKANGSFTQTGIVGSDSVTDGVFNFDSKNVNNLNAGVVNKLTPSAATINDGNGGLNYAVTYAPNNASAITKADLVLTAADLHKQYDGTASAAGVARITGGTLYAPDSLSGGSFAFNDKNVGSGKTVSVAGVTVNDGNSGGNYNVSYSPNTGSAITPASLSLSTAAVSKAYDGNVSAAGTAILAAGTLFNGDAISGGQFAFADKNVGTGKTVRTSGVTVNDGNGGSNYSVTYDDNTSSAITQASLVLSSANVSKTYDGTVSASGSAVVASGTLLSGDTISGGSFAFTDKNAGTNKTVTVGGITVNDGNGGTNYSISYTDNTASSITPASLTLSTGDVTKIYDGTVTADGKAMATGGTLYGTDTLSGGSFAFLDKNVATGKTVTASGVTISDGNNGGNYSVTYASNTASSITPANLTLSTGDVTKMYDGTVSADGKAIVTGGTLHGSDTLSGGSFAFLDKNVATGKTVTASGIIVNDGNGGANYSVTQVPNTSSSITPASLAVSTTPVTRTYDGTTAAAGTPVPVNGTQLHGDDMLSGGSYVFDTRNAGTGKTVAVDGVSVNDGNGGANYSVSYVADNASSITPAALAISTLPVTKTYDGSTIAAGTAIPVADTQLFGDDAVRGGSFTYDNRNAGSSKTVKVEAVTLDDGNDGANYSVTYVANTANTITPASVTLSTLPVTKMYYGTVAAAGTPVLTAGTLHGGDSASGGTYAYTDRYIGTGKTVTAGDVTINDGNGGANYSISYVSNTASSITSSPQSEGASQQAGAVVAEVTAEQLRLGADRPLPQWNSTRATWCLLPSSRCAVLPDLPLFVNAGGLRLPEGIVAK